jgi:DNA polymerase IIIc chi subunit
LDGAAQGNFQARCWRRTHKQFIPHKIRIGAGQTPS